MSWEREQEYYRLQALDRKDAWQLLIWALLIAAITAEVQWIIDVLRAAP